MRIQQYEIEIKKKIQTALSKIGFNDIQIPDPVKPPDGIDAEFAVPCFPFAKTLKKAPVQIAGLIQENFEDTPWIERCDVAGPYLNIKLAPESLFQNVISQINQEKTEFGTCSRDDENRLLVEYSSPNTNKPLHLGHVRNNVLGMAVIRLLQAVGNNVIPASIMNDRGIHICKAMVAYQEFGEDVTPDSQKIKGDHFVGQMYVRFDQELKNRPELLEMAREMLRKWEAGDPEVRALWKRMNEWVYEGFKDTYSRMGSVFEFIQYESDTYLAGRKIVQKGVETGVFETRDDGSVWVDLRDKGLDEKALLRKDGTSLYVTQDLGVAVERFQEKALDEAIYVVGSEQIYHFKVLFEILQKLGFQWAEKCQHLSYGMVYLPEGKMKSREGKVVDADDLMDQMKDMSLKVMENSHFSIDPEKQEAIADAIGLGAIKYYILKFNPQKDIHFDPGQSLSFEGATGAYIQYCHARIASLIKKSKELDIDFTTFSSSLFTSPEELTLIRHLMRYPTIISQSARELNPSKLATYLWEVAKSYNGFYTKNRVLNTDDRPVTQARLALSKATSTVLKNGLEILGIEAVEEM